MVWVLWDILIPLLTSFALGTLLTWLVWRRRHLNEEVVTESGMAASAGMAFEAESISKDTNTSTEAELEAANIVLIGERDKATLDLENMREEADEMRQRIAELESTDREISNQIVATAPVDVALSAGINMDNHTVNNQSAEELQRVQADLDILNDTLNKERKARRATELELLNAKNRHEKFIAETPPQVSEEQHQREITDRDVQIEELKQQLADREAVTEDSAAEDVTVEDELQDDIPETPLAENQGTTQNGYKPTGWSVPDTAPATEERDKLTDIKGVGKVLEKILHDCGIYYFHQLANLDKNGMEELQEQIPQFPGRIQRDRWVQQAKKLHKEKELVEG